jgi:hypothetical protein
MSDEQVVELLESCAMKPEDIIQLEDIKSRMEIINHGRINLERQLATSKQHGYTQVISEPPRLGLRLERGRVEEGIHQRDVLKSAN